MPRSANASWTSWSPRFAHEHLPVLGSLPAERIERFRRQEVLEDATGVIEIAAIARSVANAVARAAALPLLPRAGARSPISRFGPPTRAPPTARMIERRRLARVAIAGLPIRSAVEDDAELDRARLPCDVDVEDVLLARSDDATFAEHPREERDIGPLRSPRTRRAPAIPDRVDADRPV